MTLKEIAKRAEVSISTVSLVLSGKGRVSENVREKVLSIAKSVKYKSPLYQNTEKARDLIGVLYHIDTKWSHVYPFIRPAIQSFQKTIYGKDFTMVLIPYSSIESADTILDRINNIRIKGLCSIHYLNEELFYAIEKRGIPVVVINNSKSQDKFSTVCSDDFQGAYEGAGYLIKHGHKEILFVDYERETMSSMINDRYFGFQKSLFESGVPLLTKNRFTIHNLRSSEIEKKISRFFNKKKHPTAIFAHDDYLALHLVTALSKIGLSMPENFSIVAPGDVLDYSEPFIPGITTMQTDTAKMGELAGEMMIQRLNDYRSEPHVLKIKQKLCVRNSCKHIST